MEHLALEVFDLATTENPNPTGSQYAVLEPDASITITDTSEIFADGDVWSYDFQLNIPANAHLFGTAGEIHGSRLHEQINKRKARLWVEGVPLYLGYLKLGDEAEVDAEGNVDVSFESGQKTFEEMIEGAKAREVSVGDVIIGVALNRKRVSTMSTFGNIQFSLTGLEGYAVKDERLKGVEGCKLSSFTSGAETPYVQRWPKIVKSHGAVLNSSGVKEDRDWTNVQTPYDSAHPFCNINICYPLKVNKNGEEIATRGYTLRLAYSDKDTTDGGDNQTRYNNSPNFYLLHFIDRLFKDLKIHISENQAMDVEDLRRVFMLNYGCHYEEIEDTYQDDEIDSHATPRDKTTRYGQYYIPIVDSDGKKRLVKDWKEAGKAVYLEDYPGKVLMRDVKIEKQGYDGTLLSVGSIEGVVTGITTGYEEWPFFFSLNKTEIEQSNNAYSAYLAYATGDNYPNVEINEIIEAMKSMFGVRFLFSDDYKQVRIVLLRNIFRSTEVQNIQCDIIGTPTKTENGIRGFRMTYGKGTEDTNYYYKGFNDLLPRVAKTWKDTTDTHDYSQWELNAEYDEIKQHVSAMNKTCYVTPVNGNAYGVKIDEEEDVLFPSLFNIADFMDAEDGDCSRTEDEGKTVEEVTIGASPVIMNEVNNTYASLFSGDLRAPSPEDNEYAQKIGTFGRMTSNSIDYHPVQWWPTSDKSAYFRISGKLDIYISEGFQIRMMDNYAISNGGTPFDEADPGLCFGIMRSSGANAHIFYDNDEIENEDPMNDYWEVVPGDGAIDHPDTCDNYGNLWNYDAEAGRSCDAYYLQAAGWSVSAGSDGMASCIYHYVLNGIDFLCTPIKYTRPGARPDWNPVLTKAELEAYVTDLWNQYGWNFGDHDWWKLILSAKNANGSTAYADGRFSLKLRAEKLNPYFNATQPESENNRRYLEITNKNLQGRGLCDQFYKEYSKFIREARIANIPVRMELAQLLSIDKTKRTTVGDVTGFVKKMQFTVSNKSGLGDVTMEMMYI